MNEINTAATGDEHGSLLVACHKAKVCIPSSKNSVLVLRYIQMSNASFTSSGTIICM